MRWSRYISAIGASAVVAALSIGASPTPVAVAADPMPTSPASQLTIVSANLIEMWNNPDLGEPRELVHFAYRVRSVLTALDTPAPDVVVLQEVTKESAIRTASELTTYTGRTYAVGVHAATGAGAIEDSPDPVVRRETAILYNTATSTLSNPAASLIGYPPEQAESGWLSLRQATALVTKKNSGGKRFAIYATHFQPHNAVKDHDLYGGIWANFLKKRVDEITAYDGATPVIAGDFNRKPCINETNPALASQGYMTACTGAAGEEFSGMWAAMTTATSAGPGTYVPSRPATKGWVDNIFTTGSIVSANSDYDYKACDTGPNCFTNTENFLKCHYLYNGGKYDPDPPGGPTTTYPGGQGGSATADAISGCTERYYSDHEYLWAVIQ